LRFVAPPGPELVVSDLGLSAVQRRLAEIHERIPDLEVDVDERAEASIPAGSRPLLNEEGLAPGCMLENIYVLPGIPDEMRAMFDSIADEFVGESVSETLYTVEPESNIVSALTAVREQFGVGVGCYPDKNQRFNRLKLADTDAAVEEATTWKLMEAGPTRTRRTGRPANSCRLLYDLPAVLRSPLLFQPVEQPVDPGLGVDRVDRRPDGVRRRERPHDDVFPGEALDCRLRLRDVDRH
jgi:hypothetical protein